jgi:hypothetical protein
VKKKNEPGLEVVPNSRGVMEFTTDGVPCKPFSGYTSRDDGYLSLNESRFEPIDKSPGSLSNVRRAPQVSFGKQISRTQNLFNIQETGNYYDVD